MKYRIVAEVEWVDANGGRTWRPAMLELLVSPSGDVRHAKHIAPSAEPSGNTGELPVCETCRDTKRVTFVYGQEYDCELSTTKPCPDCSVAQPATEQPRIWRVAWNDSSGRPCADPADNESGAYTTRFRLLLRGTQRYQNIRVQFSTDNGKTWIDEQAEREGK